MANKVNPLPLVGVRPFASMPGLISPDIATSSVNSPAFLFSGSDTSGWVISGNSTIATRITGAGQKGVRGTRARAQGLTMVSWWISTATTVTGGQLLVGFANAAWDPATTYPGGDANSIGYRDDGNSYYNGVGTSLARFGGGFRIDGVYIGDKYYFRLNGGWWNNSATANPVTATGGISGAITGDVYPAVGGDSGVSQVFSIDPLYSDVPTGITYPWGP